MLNELVSEHIQVLEAYLKVQKELVEIVQEIPIGEFEINSHRVKMMEIDIKLEQLSEKLNDSIVNLAKIKP